tara:strand:- start:188 stop:2182 length:1995 start_codon:yes stop_codon:yes gene_type:complete
MMNYDIQQTLREQRAEQERLRNRRDQNVDQSTSMLSPGTSPSAVTGNLFSQQQSFIPPTPATPGLANTGFSAAAEQRRLENLAASNAANMQNRQADILGQIPQGNFVGSPDVLQGIVESRTQEVLPENRQVDIGGQTVVGGTAPMLDAAGISNLAANRGTGTPIGPDFSAQNFFNDPGYFGYNRELFGRLADGDLGITPLDDTTRAALGLVPEGPLADAGADFRDDISGAIGSAAGAVGNLFAGDPEGEQEGGSSTMMRQQFDFIPPGDQIPPGSIADEIDKDFKDPNAGTDENSLEDGAGTGKGGPPISRFDNANLNSLETQIDGFNTGLGVQTSEDLTSAYSSGKAAVESAGGDTVFLNKFFKQISQPLKFNENGSPFLPEFPGELLQQLTRNVEQTVPNPAFLALDPQDAVAAGIPDTITTVVPTLDPAGELLLDFYNEYVGNALLMAREAQNQKNQLAVAQAQTNPFGLTAQDQLEIEKLRANPFGLTADQRLSLERQGLSETDFVELELEKQRIGARPNLIQAISGFFQPGTVAALGGTQNVEGLLSRLGAFDGAREVLPTVIQQLGGGTTQAAPISQNYLQSLVGRVPDDVLSSLETGVPLTSARLAQLERENPTALQIYLGNLAGQGTTQDEAVLESLGRTPGVQNRRASTIGAIVS